MTAAETLLAASARLRELTADVGHVPTPWIQQPYPAKQGVLTAPGEETPILMAFWGSVSEYVAAMHPAVALAMSNWLDATAGEMTAVDGTEYEHSEYPSWTAALSVAHALLGGMADRGE